METFDSHAIEAINPLLHFLLPFSSSILAIVRLLPNRITKPASHLSASFYLPASLASAPQKQISGFITGMTMYMRALGLSDFL